MSCIEHFWDISSTTVYKGGRQFDTKKRSQRMSDLQMGKIKHIDCGELSFAFGTSTAFYALRAVIYRVCGILDRTS